MNDTKGGDEDLVVVGLGELLWDVFTDSRRPGGAPANVAFHAGQLGCRGVVCSRVGSDEPGDELVEYLTGRGVDASYIQRDREHATGTVTVDTSDAEHPTYVIHEDVAWDYLECDAAWSQLLAGASAVCFGTLAQRSPVSRRAIAAALDAAADALLVYDVNLRPPWYALDRIEASLGRAHAVKLNLDEAVELGPLLGLGRLDADALARAWLDDHSLRCVCLTRGEGGCRLLSQNESADIPGQPVTVADAVGAGDAFTAALIRGLLAGASLEAVGNFANQVGALVASRPGAMPVLKDEFAALSDRWLT
jgi:fructokinase